MEHIKMEYAHTCHDCLLNAYNIDQIIGWMNKQWIWMCLVLTESVFDKMKFILACFCMFCMYCYFYLYMFTFRTFGMCRLVSYVMLMSIRNCVSSLQLCRNLDKLEPYSGFRVPGSNSHFEIGRADNKCTSCDRFSLDTFTPYFTCFDWIHVQYTPFPHSFIQANKARSATWNKFAEMTNNSLIFQYIFEDIYVSICHILTDFPQIWGNKMVEKLFFVTMLHHTTN